MSSSSTRLNLPYIQANQAQKHITHNEGMRILDGITQLSVISSTKAQPPAAPMAGDRYVVASAAVGDWAGHENALADWDVNAWLFYPPQKGWHAWDQEQNTLIIWDGENWAPLDMQNLPRLGIQAAADDYNRLTVSAPATLFNHDDTGSHQLKINKQAPANTAGLLLQTGYAGRAEIGLAGSDDLTIKVSTDGADFKTALQVDPVTGCVTFPSGTQDFGAGQGGNLFVNGTLALGHGYNYPQSFTYDADQSPDLRGSVYHAGYFDGAVRMGGYIPVDPNTAYRVSCYIMQQDIAGDWAGFANGNRHMQSIGLEFYDGAFNQITSDHVPCILNAAVLPQVDKWYQATGYIGGVDRSDTSDDFNFPPAAAFVKFYWQPNFSNRAGGFEGHPDTGGQKVYFGGAAMMPMPLAHVERLGDGRVELKVPQMNAVSGNMQYVLAANRLTLL